MTDTLDILKERLPEAAKDIKLNLGSLLASTVLSPAQVWGVAVASAGAAREPRLLAALKAEAEGKVGPAVVDDALAAAALMAMNNVFYRFRHLVEKPSYGDKRTGLRMNRIAKPATNKLDFELMCLAVSAINGCGVCVQAHEKVVIDGGLSEDQVLESVRIASVVQATAVSLELAA